MPKKTFSLQDALHLKLKALYDIELQLIKALPKMAKAATDKELARGFKEHLAETTNQVKRLEQAFTILGKKPQKTKVEAIRGLVLDADWVMKNVSGSEVLDLNLVAAASYVEHYEMAGYMAAAEWAQALGLDDVVSLLAETLDEEVAAEEKLALLASTKLIAKANMA
jgi:ferritin-like metal-binding protein YciE